MAGELIFYTHPWSRGRIARWMLEEVGRPYQTEVIDYGPAMKAPAYLAINPMGKVPALRHGDTIVTECAAICAYLADAFPETGLAPPPGDPRRGPYYRWLFFGAGPVEASWIDKMLGVEVPADKKPMTGYGSIAEVTDVLASTLAGRDYILGDRFSAADVYLGSQIAWGVEFGTFEKRPAFERYLARIMARPAAVRAREIDDALMKDHPVPGAPSP